MNKDHSYNSKENKFKKEVWNSSSNLGSPRMDKDLKSSRKMAPRSLFKRLINAFGSSSNLLHQWLPPSWWKSCCRSPKKTPNKGVVAVQEDKNPPNPLFWCPNFLKKINFLSLTRIHEGTWYPVRLPAKSHKNSSYGTIPTIIISYKNSSCAIFLQIYTFDPSIFSVKFSLLSANFCNNFKLILFIFLLETNGMK